VTQWKKQKKRIQRAEKQKARDCAMELEVGESYFGKTRVKRHRGGEGEDTDQRKHVKNRSILSENSLFLSLYRRKKEEDTPHKKSLQKTRKRRKSLREKERGPAAPPPERRDKKSTHLG